MTTANMDKVFKELNKVPPEEIYAVYLTIKDFVSEKLTTHQKQTEEKASELQSKIDKIKGN